MKMEIVYRKIDEIIPYPDNPRLNDNAVKAVRASIKEFGFKVPIVVDENNVIIMGHTRRKAAIKLKLDEVPVIVADDLTDEQVKALRLADNKTSELAEWDMDLLAKELESITGLNMEAFGFESLDALVDEQEVEKYSQNTKIPQYQITGEEPYIEELVDTGKADELIAEIEQADIADDIKDFLKMAAYRHYVFNYKKIAEYYRHRDADVQELFEKSALVIIDFNDALKYGYAKLSSKMLELIDRDKGEDDV